MLAARCAVDLDGALLDDIAADMARVGWADPDAPGRVYEARLAAQRSRRRAGGAYYTPPFLVDFLVDRVIGDRASVRVVDPSCGGGAFLLGALRAGVPAANLVGVDIDPVAAAVCRLGLELAGAGAAQVLVADGLWDEVGTGYDVVIGNPPWGQKGFKYGDAEAARIRAAFRTGRGVLDPFKLFVERAHQLVREGGRWGFVLPDIILLKNQQPVRDLILEQSTIEWIAHAGRAFPAVNLDAVVLSARRAAAPPAHRVHIWHELPGDWQAAPPPTHRLEQRVFGELPGHRFNLYLTDASLGLLRRLESFRRFGDVFEAHEGVHTGNSRDKLFLERRAHDQCVELVVGRDELAPFVLEWGGAWLDRSPGALDRDAGDYANLGRPEWHQRPKLVVRRTGDRLIAAVDGHGYYCSNNLFVVLPRDDAGDAELAAYAALLNSRFMTWYFRTVQPRTGRLFAELKIQHLSAFPVPDDVCTLGELGACIERAARAGQSTDALMAQLDRAVCDAFGLSASERQLVSGGSAPG